MNVGFGSNSDSNNICKEIVLRVLLLSEVYRELRQCHLVNLKLYFVMLTLFSQVVVRYFVKWSSYLLQAKARVRKP